jgi:hypothetical protein
MVGFALVVYTSTVCHGGVSTHSTLQGVKYVGVNFSVLVENTEGTFEGEQAPYIIGIVKPPKQDFALDIVKAQKESLVSTRIGTRHTFWKPRHKGWYCCIRKHLVGISHHYCTATTNSIPTLPHILRVVCDFHHGSGGFAASDWPRDE